MQWIRGNTFLIIVFVTSYYWQYRLFISFLYRLDEINYAHLPISFSVVHLDLSLWFHHSGLPSNMLFKCVSISFFIFVFWFLFLLTISNQPVADLSSSPPLMTRPGLVSAPSFNQATPHCSLSMKTVTGLLMTSAY